MDSNFPRVNKLPPYVFDEIQKLKAAARKRGEDIIDFGMGNPDQSTPEEIVEKLENGETGRDDRPVKEQKILKITLQGAPSLASKKE